MSIQEAMQFRDQPMSHDQRKELAKSRDWFFYLEANPVWGACESSNVIALFDTIEAAEEYIEKSRLPKSVTTDGGRIHRTFRPDSLLYDYNCTGAGFSMNGNGKSERYPGMIFSANPLYDFDGGIVQNPSSNFGELSVEFRKLAHAQYGVDYDAGFGPNPETGEYTNMDGEVPELPAGHPR